MHVSHLSASPIQTADLKSKELATTQAQAANSSTANAGAAPSTQAATVSSQLPAFDDSGIADADSARKSVDFASSSILGDSNTALAAQANLNPETVLQLLAD